MQLADVPFWYPTRVLLPQVSGTELSDDFLNQKKLVPILHYDGMPMNARFVVDRIREEMDKGVAA